MIFTTITKDLQKELKSNLPQIMVLLKKQPAIAYKTIGDISKEVGRKYDIELLVNFPHRGKIENFDIKIGFIGEIIHFFPLNPNLFDSICLIHK